MNRVRSVKYDPVVLNLALSREFINRLMEETEKAELAHGAHVFYPENILQLAKIVYKKVNDEQ